MMEVEAVQKEGWGVVDEKLSERCNVHRLSLENYPTSSRRRRCDKEKVNLD